MHYATEQYNRARVVLEGLSQDIKFWKESIHDAEKKSMELRDFMSELLPLVKKNDGDDE